VGQEVVLTKESRAIYWMRMAARTGTIIPPRRQNTPALKEVDGVAETLRMNGGRCRDQGLPYHRCLATMMRSHTNPGGCVTGGKRSTRIVMVGVEVTASIRMGDDILDL